MCLQLLTGFLTGVICAGFSDPDKTGVIDFNQVIELSVPVITPSHNFLLTSAEVFGPDVARNLHFYATILFPIIPILTMHFFNMILIPVCVLSVLGQIPNIIYTTKYIENAADILKANIYIICATVLPFLSFFLMPYVLVFHIFLVLAKIAMSIFEDNYDTEIVINHIRFGLAYMFWDYPKIFLFVYYLFMLCEYNSFWFPRRGSGGWNRTNVFDPELVERQNTDTGFYLPDFNTKISDAALPVARPSDQAYISARKIFGKWAVYLHILACFSGPLIPWLVGPGINPILAIGLANFVFQIPNLILQLQSDDGLSFWDAITELCYIIIPSMCMYSIKFAFAAIALETLISIFKNMRERSKMIAAGYTKEKVAVSLKTELKIMPTRLILICYSLIKSPVFVIIYYLFLLYRYLPLWWRDIFFYRRIKTYHAVPLDKAYILTDLRALMHFD